MLRYLKQRSLAQYGRFFFFASLILIALYILIRQSDNLYMFLCVVSFFVFPYLLAMLLTGQNKRSALFAVWFLILIYYLSRLKSIFYKEPLLFSDYHLIIDPANWDVLLQYPYLGLAIVVLIVLTVFSFFWMRHETKQHPAFRIASLCVASLFLYVTYHILSSEVAGQEWLKTLDTVRQRGKVFTNLLMSLRDIHYRSPSISANDAVFLQKTNAIPPFSNSSNAIPSDPKKPDIIVWLQESTVDPAFFAFPGVALPRLKMFQDDQVKAKSWLRVHTFGGGTWRSEFAFLSGLPSTDFGAFANSIYYTVTPHLRYSLFKILKQNGYETVVLNPFHPNSHQAGAAYRDLRLDTLYRPQDFRYPAPRRKNIWDIESQKLADIAWQIVSQKREKPLFLFLLTIKEHGPYRRDVSPPYPLDQRFATAIIASKFTDYLQRLVALDAATQNFDQKMKARGKPYLFAYFGDHQPKIDDAIERYNTPFPNPHYLTQVAVNSNLPGPFPIMGPLIDLAFLGGWLLEAAGLKPDPFFNANIKMQKACGGLLEDCPDKALVESYRAYLYKTLRAADRTD